MNKPKYETGAYHVLLFGKHGTQTGKESADTYEEAHRIGKAQIQRPPAASYVVTRVMYNSLDAYYPWQVTDEEEVGVVRRLE